MKKTMWIITILIVAVLIGFFIGIYLYNKEENEKQLENDIAKVEYNSILNSTNKIEIQTSSEEEKVSINTEVMEEVYYTKCDHLIENKRSNIKNIVNMTKQKLEKKYPEWEIKEFSKDRVILYKEVKDYCGEHFLIKDVDGFVTVYKMDISDKIKEQIKITDIETVYLPKADQETLKEGIKIYSEQKLNKIIEDFE